MSVIKVEHPNGYMGVLYGKSSMSIYDKDGHEVLHTGFRTPNTKEELYETLEDMPRVAEMIAQIIKEDRKTEPTISKMEQVDEPQYDAEDQFCIEHNCPHFYQFGGCMNQGDCPYDEDEPQTNADQHVQHVESVEPTWAKKEHEAFYTFLWNVINPNEMQDYIEMFETKDEPQTCSVNGRPYDCGNCEYFRCTADEPQTNKEIVLDPSFAELSDEQFVEAMKLIEPQTDCPWK